MSISIIKYPVAATAGTVTGADNGLSVSSNIVQLGQTIGQSGSPAALLGNREIPMGSNSLVFTGSGKIGINMNAPTVSLAVNGDGYVSDRGYPSLGLGSNFPARFYVVSGGSNQGLAIVRATADTGSPILSFYKTRNADASIRTALVPGDSMGIINFFAPTANASIIANSSRISVILETTANAYNSSYLQIGTTTAAGSYAERLRLSADGNLYLGASTNATAVLQIKAGTTAASTAPLKFTSGSLMTTAEAGAIEFLTDKAYLTITTGAARKEFTLNDTALTTAAFPVATTNGRLTDGPLTLVGSSPFDILTSTKPVQGVSFIVTSGPSLSTTGLNFTDNFLFQGGGTKMLNVDAFTFFGNSVTDPTAVVHLVGGTATANTAPLKFTSGTNLTTAETGAVEYNGTNLFLTRTGTTRETVWTGNSGASAPTTSIGATIINFYGSSATNFLGDPNSWASVVIGGVTYKIPLYI